MEVVSLVIAGPNGEIGASEIECAQSPVRFVKAVVSFRCPEFNSLVRELKVPTTTRKCVFVLN